MRILGLFKFSDITRERLVIMNIDEQEFVKRLSAITDSSTNTGFIHGKKKFHGVVGSNGFRVKTISRWMFDDIITKGAITKKNEELIVNVEYDRNIFMVLLPTIIFVFVTLLFIKTAAAANFHWGGALFIATPAILAIIFLEYKRETDLEEVRNLLSGLDRGEPRS